MKINNISIIQKVIVHAKIVNAKIAKKNANFRKFKFNTPTVMLIKRKIKNSIKKKKITLLPSCRPEEMGVKDYYRKFES